MRWEALCTAGVGREREREEVAEKQEKRCLYIGVWEYGRMGVWEYWESWSTAGGVGGEGEGPTVMWINGLRRVYLFTGDLGVRLETTHCYGREVSGRLAR